MAELWAIIAPTLYRLGRLIFAILPRKLKMPAIFYGNPFNGVNDDPNLCWLHIQVHIPRKYFWQHDTIYNARIYALLDGNEEAQLLWRGDMGPTAEINLLCGDPPRSVPVVIRLGCIAERWPSIDPTRFSGFLVRRFETLLTTIDVTLRRGTNRINIDSGLRVLKFRIRSGNDFFDSNRFNLSVPKNGEGNDDFKIHAL